MHAKSDFFFEVSWEVVNKVGGINTVIKTKSPIMDKIYQNYFLIGPYFEKNYEIEVVPRDPPSWLKKVFLDLEGKGLKFYFGTWQIKGEPEVILIDFKSLVAKKNEIKKLYWDWFKIDSLFSNWDFEEPLLWGYSVGLLLQSIEQVLKGKAISGQFHEWLSGSALLYLKHVNSRIASVFTTHATMLGRSIAGNGGNLYAELNSINPEAEAKRFGIMDKFTMEKQSALNADVFTTVSEITAMEAEKLLGRKPEVIVMNGIDVEKYPTFEECSVRHTKYREQIREFIKSYFYPYYYFDTNHTLILFTAARYEFRNKGFDVLISALGKLNNILKEQNSRRTAVMFFFVPRGNDGPKKEILENKSAYKNITHVVDDYYDEINRNIVDSFISQTNINYKGIFPDDFLVTMRRLAYNFKKKGLPPLTTHVFDESKDPIINAFKANGLLNRAEDRIKVIFYPVYLNGADGLLDLTYNDTIVGSHLGIFPSYYEPWGYTPLETAAFGVPSITSDLAGFGRFIEPQLPEENKGIFILHRMNKSYDEIVDEFTKLLYDYVILHRHERVMHKMNAKSLSKLADWEELVKNYVQAHNLALQRKYEHNFQ